MTNRTLAEYPRQLAEAAEFIRNHDDFLVVSHVSPDGDAASSTSAVGWMLQQLNKRYIMANEGHIPAKFEYLWGYADILNASEMTPKRDYKYVISVDCADFERIGAVSDWFAPDVQILNIDHHPTNDGFGAVQLIKDDAAATAEVLYDLIEQLQLPWNKDISTSIYTGLLTDTGGFRYSNTSPKVMKIASDLLAYGTEGFKLAEHLLETLSYSHILLLKKALNRLSFTNDRKIAWLSVTLQDLEETGASSEDLEGLVNYPRNIEGVEVGLLFKETGPEKVKVSFRSAGKVDVSQIAKAFGGGGHVKASGCTILGNMDDIIGQVVDTVAKEMI